MVKKRTFDEDKGAQEGHDTRYFTIPKVRYSATRYDDQSPTSPAVNPIEHRFITFIRQIRAPSFLISPRESSNMFLSNAV